MSAPAPAATPAPAAAPAAAAAAPAAPGSPGLPGAGAPAQPRPLSASLYVGDLDPEVGESLLFDMFKQLGPVASIRVCRDAMTRRSLGYAYVNFHNADDAERAIDTLNYNLIKGRPCRIMWSHRDPSIRKSGAANIFIKNLDKTLDNKALYDTFSTFGNILSCKVVTDDQGNSKGYGFVHYETQEFADAAINNVNGMLLNGKIVYVGMFVPKKDRKPVDPEETFTNVYVKNLDESVDDAQFQSLFDGYGKITSASVSRGPDGKSKGFGFVNFDSHEQAQKACNDLNGKKVGEKNIYCGRAQKKSEREAELREKFKKIKEERMNKWQGVNLYVKNLDDTIDEEKLTQAFSEFGGIASVKIMSDEKGNSKGFGFVCFNKPEEATKAVTEMNSRMLGTKPIYVALAQRKEVRRAQLEQQHAQRAQGMRPVAPGMVPPMYAGAPVFYPQPPPGPAGARPGYVYPQQVAMPRRPWPGAPGGQPGAGGAGGVPRAAPFQPMPNFVMPMGGHQPQQAQQQQQRQAGRPPRGGRGGAGGVAGGPPGGPQSNGRGGAPTSVGRGGAGSVPGRGFKYTSNVRNPGAARSDPLAMLQGGPQGVPGSQPAGAPAGLAEGMDALTPSRLALANAEERKQLIGDILYQQIAQIVPATATKITGMILESNMDTADLVHLLEDRASLDEKISQAQAVLADSKYEEEEEAEAQE